MPSPAPHASNTAQGEGVPALSGSEVKSDTVEEVLLSRRGSSDVESVISCSSSGRGRLDLNRRKSTTLLLLLWLATRDAAAEDVGNTDEDEGHLVLAAADRAAR